MDKHSVNINTAWSGVA